MLLTLWAASGTLAPYGATIPDSFVSEPCKYLYNSDHPHLIAPFQMFNGAPRNLWDFSVVLRRILYPLLALPVIRAIGLEWGGLLVNMVLHLMAMAYFAVTLRDRAQTREVGEKTAAIALWLVALFPGAAYWGGLPYAYAAIIPGSLALTATLLRLERATTARQVLGLAAFSGILFTAYDFLFYFGVAFLVQLGLARRWKLLLPCLLLLLIPQELVNQWLRLAQHISFENSNTQTFGRIIRAWLHPAPSREWALLLARFPLYWIDNYLSATHVGLPLLFGWVSVRAIRRKGLRAAVRTLTPAEGVLITVTVLLFAFNNLAPPYPGWQMRGSWIPRIYQPVFAVMIAICAPRIEAAIADRPADFGRRSALAALCLTLLFNASVVFGPWLGLPHADTIHWLFYKHAPRGSMNANLEKYGRRPLGVCAK